MTLNDGEGEKGRVLASASVRAMLTPVKLNDGRAGVFGLAWRLGTIDGEPFASHDGGGGYRSELRVYPRLGYVVAVLGNETDFSTGNWPELSSGPRRSRLKCKFWTAL
jgi:hypothetical protein